MGVDMFHYTLTSVNAKGRVAVPRKPPPDRLIGSPEYQRSADDRQREVLDEIQRLGARIAVVERDLANDKTTLDKLIQIARQQGASWAKIGEALGISAQAAHQRAARKTTNPIPSD
jgi:hypothetical protein